MSEGEYVPLWNKTNYSFLTGASHPDELVEAAMLLGLGGVAITDLDGVYGVVRAHTRAKELGAHLVIGAQLSIDDGSHLVLLARDRVGYANLCQLISTGRLRCEKGQSRVGWAEVCERAAGLTALWGGEGSLLTGEAEPDLVGHDLKDAFEEHLYALLTRHHEGADVPREALLRERALRLELPTVAGMEVLYHSAARRPLHDVLTCIKHHVTLGTAGRLIRPNAEHALRSAAGMRALYADDPTSLRRTLEVAYACRFTLDELRYRYPSERLPDGRTSAEHLRALCEVGARWRYGAPLPAPVTAQLDKELALISELDYCGYFLTMYEIVEFCRARDILCQGRGSAANSVVCYVLGVTAIDPVASGLLFERFISRERSEAPDIDLDIAHARREEVIQHVYEKYGRTHAAMVANVIRYRGRSALREVGKALGISETALDRTAKLMSHYHGELDRQTLDAAGLADTPQHRHLAQLVAELEDFPRHLSIHPGGFLLGHEPVATLVPVENGAMEDRTVIQWDKDDLEELGLFKVDLLGLGALTQIDLTLRAIARHRGVALTMATIPHEDAATYRMVSAADTVGVFQIESRAQMSMLPRLKPKTFYDLVIEVSIVRPGPITGGMVHPFLRRREGVEPIDYPHPALEPVLEKTLGVPLFQEQVMRIAMVAADYTPGEADQLRRDMAAWRRSGRIEAHRERLTSRMQQKGISPEFCERVFNQIRGFGSYGFPESHAASFALIAYATSYLKCHYLPEFTCGLLNAQPMGFYAPATIIDDAKRHALELRPIDVTCSAWDCTLEAASGAHPLALRMGLRYVRGLSEAQGRRIVATRPFGDLEDFLRRTGEPSAHARDEAAPPETPVDVGALDSLAECGALEAFGVDRRQALWQVRAAAARRSPLALSRLDEEPPQFTPLSGASLINWDYRASSHSPRGHLLEPLRELLAAQGFPEAQEVRAMRDGRMAKYAGLVICRQRPGTAKGVVFMTLEDETGFVNVVLWNDVFTRYAVLAKTASLLAVRGKIQSHSNVVHIVAKELWEPELSAMPARPKSRDFH